MAVERLTVSLDTLLAATIRAAAEAEGQDVSAWMAEAARQRLAEHGLPEILKAWKRDHGGALTDDEIAAVRRLLQL